MPVFNYNERDHYWRINMEVTWYSSASHTYVGSVPQSFYDRGGVVTDIASEDLLWEYLGSVYPEGIPEGKVNPKPDSSLTARVYDLEERLKKLENK